MRPHRKMTISAARQRELLNAQTAIARKVFEVVPMQESWTPHQIGGALQQQTRSSIQFRTLERCLITLRESGLVIEPRPGFFQQIAPREQVKAVPYTKPEEEATKPSDAAQVLSELATRARRLADDIDAAAEVIGEQQTSNEDAAKKLAQLQSIFKSL